MHIHVCVYIYMYICVFTFIEREREVSRDMIINNGDLSGEKAFLIPSPMFGPPIHRSITFN